MWYCVKEGKEAQDLRGKSGWIAITQRGKAICYNGHQWAAAFQGHSITYHRHQHDTIGNSKTENLHYCTNLVPHNLIVFPSFFYSSSSATVSSCPGRKLRRALDWSTGPSNRSSYKSIEFRVSLLSSRQRRTKSSKSSPAHCRSVS